MKKVNALPVLFFTCLLLLYTFEPLVYFCFSWLDFLLLSFYLCSSECVKCLHPLTHLCCSVTLNTSLVFMSSRKAWVILIHVWDFQFILGSYSLRKVLLYLHVFIICLSCLWAWLVNSLSLVTLSNLKCTSAAYCGTIGIQ